jgi:predicted N-acetyltransferase YhbS
MSSTEAVRSEQGAVAEAAAGDAIEIRLAGPTDNEGLLALTRATPMAGTIALRIDRDPDFFALLRARGEAVVYVATYRGQIIGCMSAALHMAYVSGVPERICHVGDLKVHPQFTGRRLSLRLIAAIEAHLRGEGIDLCFSLVARGNHRVVPVLDGRHGTPKEVDLGEFIVDQLLPSPFRARSRRYRIEVAVEDDLAEIAAMLEDACRWRQFGPQISVQDIAPPLQPDHFLRMLVARDAGRIVATLTLEDTSRLRQNVLIGIPGRLRVALGVLQVLTLPIPRLSVPRIGQPLTMLHVRHMACAQGHELAMRSLIAEARVEAFGRRYTFLSVGLHERDPLRTAVTGFAGFRFHSLAMATSLITPNRVHGLISEVPYEDFALV